MIFSSVRGCYHFVNQAARAAAFGLVIGLSACGGGGGGSSADRSPADFTLAFEEDTYEAGATATTNTVTITSIDNNTPISIEGEGATYSIDGDVFTDESGTIASNQTLQVQATASDVFDEELEISITIGRVTETFTLTTESEDTEPDAFELGDEVNIEPGDTAESEVITISGINAPATISISNGEYQIVGVQDYTTDTLTVEAGQEVQVRVTALDTIGEAQTATLTIDSLSDTFAAIASDFVAPTSEVVFPAPNTMSDGSFVTLRGKAFDDESDIAQIIATVTNEDGTETYSEHTLTAGDDDDFKTTWSLPVDLESEVINTIEVVAVDAAGNTQEEPITLTVWQTADALTTGFPVGNSVSLGTHEFNGMDWDRDKSRLLVTRRGPNQIIEIDITSGERDIFVDIDNVVSDFSSTSGIDIFPDENAFLFYDQNNGVIYRGDMDTGEFDVLSDQNTVDSNVGISFPYATEISVNGVVYGVDAVGTLFELDLSTGARTLVSGEARPTDGSNPFVNSSGLALDEPNNQAFVSDLTSQEIFAVDLSSGERTIIVSADQFQEPVFIAFDETENTLYVPDNEAEAIYKVDTLTGQVTELSSASIPQNGANRVGSPWSITIDTADNIGFIGVQESLFSPNATIMHIDLDSGERIILSNSIVQ